MYVEQRIDVQFLLTATVQPVVADAVDAFSAKLFGKFDTEAANGRQEAVVHSTGERGDDQEEHWSLVLCVAAADAARSGKMMMKGQQLRGLQRHELEHRLGRRAAGL